MKWYNSIITKISLIFIFAIVGVIAVLFTFANYQLQKDLQNAKRFAKIAIHSSHNMNNHEINFKKLKTLGIMIVKNRTIRKRVLSRPFFLKSHQKDPDIMSNMMGISIRSAIYNKQIYIVLKRKRKRAVILSTPYTEDSYSHILFPILSILFIVLLYIAIIKNILPLYALRKKIKQFADGDYNIDCKSNNKDEIGALGNEFDKAVNKIKSLKDSRQLFLRNIMHELKTPITKGRFAAEITQDENLKKSLINIFKRQEYLIDEFAKIEKLNADELQLNIKEYLLEDIIDFAKDILNHDNSQIIMDLTPIKLSVDFELFGTVIKNLLDNGINYSSNSTVAISNNDKIIKISNKGEKLEFPLEDYAQPYFLKGIKQKNSRGLGFGLYIILHIIKLHNMKIIYKRERDMNVFEILLK